MPKYHFKIKRIDDRPIYACPVCIHQQDTGDSIDITIARMQNLRKSIYSDSQFKI